MKKNYSTFVTLIVLTVLGTISTFAQQVPNPGFEDWSGEKFDGNIQPASWFASNVSQAGFNFNFANREAGHTGSYSMMVKDTEVGAMGITETSPGYFALGKPWTHLEGLSTSTATAGTAGGINWTHRPDTMSVWIKRTGSNTDKEDFYLLYYAWSGTAKSSQYKNKGGGCTSVSQTNEESDIRLALNANECSTDQKANQIAEGMWRERKTYGEWTNIRVPIYYFNDDAPSMMNIIFSASNYPNFRANDGLYEGNSLYVDDVEMIYSSKIDKLYIREREWKAFDPNSTEEQVYSVGKATEIPDVFGVRGAGTITNARGDKATFPGRKLGGEEFQILQQGTIDGDPMIIQTKAADGSSTSTYKIKFVSVASNNARLADIQVNGNNIAGFNAYLNTYNVQLPYGTTEAPVVTATAQDGGATVSITQPTSTTGTATILVTAADGTTKNTYTVNFSVAQLSDNTLEAIYMDGELLPGFVPTKNNYTISLPLGTTEAPIITWQSAYAEGAQTIALVKNSLAEGAQITVSAPAAQGTRTYKLTYKIEASSYAYLSGISLDGQPIEGFSPEQTSYSITLPIGTTSLPSITWTQGDPYQTVSITEGGVDGTTRIVVTAAAGNSVTYRLNFSTEKSTNNTLQGIALEGTPLEGFHPDTLNYIITLPAGTTTLPVVTYTQGDEYQTVTINTSTTTRTVRIMVKAGDGSSRVYTLTFEIEKSANALLKMIYLDGDSLNGFAPDQLTYTVALDEEIIPEITVKQNPGQKVNIVQPAGFGTGRIVVEPEVGTPVEYTIIFTSTSEPVIPEFATDSFKLLTDASLAAIYINGELYQQNPTPQTYTYNLPWHTEQVPSVVPVAGAVGQTITVTSPGLNKTTTIHVVAQDGVTTADYAIHFPVAKSSNTQLESIEIDGVTFDYTPDTREYTISLPYGTTTVPTITFTKMEVEQKVELCTNGLSAPATIKVTAEDGTQGTYTITFTVGYAPYENTLLSIVVDNIGALDLSAGADHTVSLPYGTSEIQFSIVKQYPEQEVIILNGGVTTPSTITVKADDPAKAETVYTITPSLLTYPAYSLTSVQLDSIAFEDFNPNTFNYIINTPTVPTLTYTVTEGATAEIIAKDDKHTKIEVIDGDNNVRLYNFYYYNPPTIYPKGLPLGQVLTEELYKACCTKEGGDVTWQASVNGVRVGGSSTSIVSGPAWNWDDKYFVLELGTGIPQSVTFNFRTNNATSTDPIWYVAESTDGSSWTNIWTTSSSSTTFASATATTSPTARYLKFCFSGNFAGYFQNIIVNSYQFSSNSTLTALTVDGDSAQLSGTAFTYTYPEGVINPDPELIFTGDTLLQGQSIEWGNWSADGKTRNIAIRNFAEDGSYTDYTLTLTRTIPAAETTILPADSGAISGGEQTTITEAEPFPYAPSSATLEGVMEENGILVYETTSPLDTVTIEVTDTAYHIDVYGTVGKNHYCVSRQASNNALLSAIYLDGAPLNEFYESTFTYQVTLPTLPIVTATAVEPDAQVQTALLRQDDTHYVVFIQVTAPDGYTKQGYTVAMNIRKLRSTALLNDIRANNVSIDGFAPTTFAYNIILPAGVSIPTFKAITADGATAVTSTTKQERITTITYEVTSEDCTANNTYNVVVEQLQSSVCTLDAIYLDGTPLEGFDQHTQQYNVELPYGTIQLPKVTATVSDPAATYEIEMDTTLMQAIITVTAENNDQMTYTIYFTIAKNTDATLSGIYADGILVANFDAMTFNYIVDVPFGALLPTLTATPTDSNAIATIESVDTMHYNIIVTAEDEKTTLTYTVTLTYLPSTNSNLLNIFLNEEPMEGFNSSDYEYAITLPYGIPLPEVTWQVADTQQVVVAEWESKTIHLTVTAGDETTVSEYTITFTNELSNNNYLESITLNGELLNTFHRDSLAYTITYPVGSDSTELVKAEEVVAIPEDSTAVVAVQAQGTTLVIIVTAANGDIRAYSIEQIIELSNEARLSMIYIDSIAVDGFDPDIYEYTLKLPQGAIVPMITATPIDTLRAEVELGMEKTLEDGTKLIEVDGIAEDGTRLTYSVYFTYADWSPTADAVIGDCLFFPVQGADNTFRAVTISLGVKCAIYSVNGALLTIMDVPVLDVNSVEVEHNENGEQVIKEGSVPNDAIGADYIATPGMPFVYIFYNGNSKRIGKGGKYLPM